MELRHYLQLAEKVYWERLPNGLTIAVVPRPGFTKKLAYYVTDFGSVHTDYTENGQTHTFPAGIAHFLEHKLFDMPGRDITAEFAALGAVPNAFTGYDMTAYYFSCTEHFPQCLQLLLEMVGTPYFTDESALKEQGIIGQEIDMNADNPDTRVFEQLMELMYTRHNVRQPILGTRETIAQIDAQVLQRCHNAFYCPGNSFLCVVGDVDPEQVSAMAAAGLPKQCTPPADAIRSWQEDMHLQEHYIEASMEVSMPTFQLGFKCEPLGRGEDAVRHEIVADLAAEALFGESSSLYLQLYEQGLIDSSFGGGFETIEGMAMLSASGDSDDPQAVLDAILEQAQVLVKEGIPQEDFLRMKRSALGRRIRALDSFDATCFRICAYHFSGFDYFRFPALYRDAEVSDILEFIQRVVTPDRAGLSVILPLEQEETVCI